MKFDQAIYRKEDESRSINVEDIIREVDYEDVIENLYCPHIGCNAKLQYNQKSNGNDYLSKRKGEFHSDNCPLDDGYVNVRTISFIQDENGRVSDQGVDRRKDDAMNALDDFFNPPEPKERKPYKPRARKKEADKDDENVTIEVKEGRRIKYDPTAQIVDNTSEESTYEPPFYQRRIHQMTKKDQGKNLKTSAKIERIVIREEQQRAKIFGSFEGTEAIFEITPIFFNSSRRNLQSSELMGYLKVLKKYIENSTNNLYLTTLCQSEKFETSNIVLFIYEPDFMGFQFIGGRRFKTLTDLIIAIQTNVI